MQYSEPTYNKKYVIYLKFTFNRHPAFFAKWIK